MVRPLKLQNYYLIDDKNVRIKKSQIVKIPK